MVRMDKFDSDNIYSLESYFNPRLSFTISSRTPSAFIGLSINPSQSTQSSNLDYGFYLSEDGSYTDFNTSADTSKQYKQSSNQYNEYNNSQPNNINIANSTSNISKLFERAVDTEDINNNTTSYDDMRQSKISHQSDEESQLSAYLQWLEAQHIKDDNNDYEDDNQNPKQSFRSFDDMDIPRVRHPRDQAMITERQ